MVELDEQSVEQLESLLGLDRDGNYHQVTRVQNGVYTITNPKSKQHRTFKVHTQKETAKFAPGKRILSVLTGADNQNDYTGVAFIDDRAVGVWKRHMGSEFEALVRFFWSRVVEEKHMDFSVLMEGRCCKCNRPLTVPESIITGIGPICADRGARDAGIDPKLVKYYRLKAKVEGTV